MTTAKAIQRSPSHAEQIAEVYRYRATQTDAERSASVWEATAAAYAFKGISYVPTRRSPAALMRIQRAQNERSRPLNAAH